jgi:hypothetical protein
MCRRYDERMKSTALIVFGIVFLGFLLFAGMKLGSVGKSAGECALGTCPLTLHESDAGKTFHYNPMTRVTLLLNKNTYPPAGLRCVPEGVIGIMGDMPQADPSLHATRLETLSPGACTLVNGKFSINIVVGS